MTIDNVPDFDFSKLRGRMQEKNIKQESLAKMTGISLTSLNEKLNNKKKFKQPEIFSICNTLKINPKNISKYFFTPLVRKDEQTPNHERDVG